MWPLDGGNAFGVLLSGGSGVGTPGKAQPSSTVTKGRVRRSGRKARRGFEGPCSPVVSRSGSPQNSRWNLSKNFADPLIGTLARYQIPVPHALITDLLPSGQIVNDGSEQVANYIVHRCAEIEQCPLFVPISGIC